MNTLNTLNTRWFTIAAGKKVSRRQILLYGALFLLATSGTTGAYLYFSDFFDPPVEHGFGAKAFGAGAYGR
jgi:hypothetical protein